MTKQYKIKEAYGEKYNPYNIDENGWMKYNLWMHFFKKVDDDYYEFDNRNMRVRPNLLTGIEDNNGWIKIESEDDLPNGDYALYHVISKNNIYCNEPKNQGIEEFWGNDTEKKDFWLKEFTHYQPIIKPDLPLY